MNKRPALKPISSILRYLCDMATSSNFEQSRPGTLVVRRLAGKISPTQVRPAKAATHRCEPRMTKQEAEVFFAACETPVKAEIDIFAHLPQVAQWFQD